MGKSHLLITGAQGFIGFHVTQRFLVQEKYQVIAISRGIEREKPSKHFNNPGVVLVKGNFFDAELLEQLFTAYPIQHVVHLAAVRGAGSRKESDYITVNVQGTESLLEASLKHQVKKFIFCSSVGVYGTIPIELPANVNSPLHGDSHYHKSKILAEEKVQEFITRGLDAYIVRPTITYGTGDNGFPKILVELVRKRLLLLPSIDINIHLLNVNNFAELFLHIIEAERLNQRVFIAGDETSISLRELADVIHQHYYHTDYPSLLKLPEPFYRMLQTTFRILRNEKWLTRILLISKSWQYDISDTVNKLPYIPAKTRESFINSMKM